MTNPQNYDALVVGGGVNGLTAAAYLAKARKRTLLVEARDCLGGLCATEDLGNGHLAPAIAHVLYALDPRVVAELKLTARGLRFAQRDAPLALLRDDGERLLLTRDVRASARSIAVHSKADAEAWPHYRRELFMQGRSRRAHWWDVDGKRVPDESVDHLARMGAGAWLDSWFESDALKALLTFDALPLSPLDAGSSLILAWRAAQEMCGLQAAVALPAGGLRTLVGALTRVCESAGVEIRTKTTVAELTIGDNRVTGARLDSGDMIAASMVFSGLSKRTTLLDLAHGAGIGFSERRIIEDASQSAAAVKIVLTLDDVPEPDGLAEAMKGRLILADRPESYVTAHAAACRDRIPEEIVMEVVFPSAADPSLSPLGGRIASVLVQPVPYNVPGGWEAMKANFAARVITSLNHRIPGLLDHVTAVDVLTPDILTSRYGTRPTAPSVEHMLADWPARVRTPIDGLFLCGTDAEPVSAISGRAGRIAAALAIRSLSSR